MQQKVLSIVSGLAVLLMPLGLCAQSLPSADSIQLLQKSFTELSQKIEAEKLKAIGSLSSTKNSLIQNTQQQKKDACEREVNSAALLGRQGDCGRSDSYYDQRLSDLEREFSVENVGGIVQRGAAA